MVEQTILKGSEILDGSAPAGPSGRGGGSGGVVLELAAAAAARLGVLVALVHDEARRVERRAARAD